MVLYVLPIYLLFLGWEVTVAILLCKIVIMPRLMTERLKDLRQEIAEISKANELYTKQKGGAAEAEHQRRLQRLEEILAELRSLTDWKKP